LVYFFFEFNTTYNNLPEIISQPLLSSLDLFSSIFSPLPPLLLISHFFLLPLPKVPIEWERRGGDMLLPPFASIR
jgi:hypothetical protein